MTLWRRIPRGKRRRSRHFSLVVCVFFFSIKVYYKNLNYQPNAVLSIGSKLSYGCCKRSFRWRAVSAAGGASENPAKPVTRRGGEEEEEEEGVKGEGEGEGEGEGAAEALLASVLLTSVTIFAGSTLSL